MPLLTENEQLVLNQFYRSIGPGALSGSPIKLVKATRHVLPSLTVVKAREFLNRQKSYKLYIERRKRHSAPHRWFEVSEPNQLWMIDSMYLPKGTFSRKRYATIIMDYFSKYAYGFCSVALNANAALAHLKSAIAEAGIAPLSILTDNGSEFSSVFSQFLTENKIKHLKTNFQAESKTSGTERIIKTLRRYIAKILLEKITENRIEDALDAAINIYNSTFHYSVNMTPSEARAWDKRGDIMAFKLNRRYNILSNLPPKSNVSKFAKGTLVRIMKTGDSRKFMKSHTPNFYPEIFVIDGILKNDTGYRYILKSYSGSLLKGSFAEVDLKQVENNDSE